MDGKDKTPLRKRLSSDLARREAEGDTRSGRFADTLTKTLRNKLICRLRDRIGFNTVVIEPIAVQDIGLSDQDAVPPLPFVVRSLSFHNEPSGSFWQIELEDENKPPIWGSKTGSPSGLFVPNAAGHLRSSVFRPSGTSPIGELGPIRTARSAVRLRACLLALREYARDPVELLREDGIPDIGNVVLDFVEIDKDLAVWREDLELDRGRLLARKPVRSKLRSVKLSGRHHNISMQGATIRIFVNDPVAESGHVDIRTQAEKDALVSDFLGRAINSLKLSREEQDLLSRASSLAARFSVGSTFEGEIENVKETIGQLSDRRIVSEALPTILRSDPTVVEEIRTYSEKAKAEAMMALERDLAEPRRLAEAELAAAREELEKIRRDVALASERNRAYEDASAKTKADIASDIQDAVMQFLGEDARNLSRRISDLEAAGSQDDIQVDSRSLIDGIVTDDGALARLAAALRSSGKAEPETNVEQTRALASSNGDRGNSLRTWSYQAHTYFPDLVAAVALSATWSLPALFGQNRDNTADALCNAIGGGEYYVVHCDPTMVSLADVVGRETDFFRPLVNAIEEATEHPDVLVPVLFRNINYAPCQFWLQAITDRRDGYPLPRNLFVVSTLASDEGRVGVPDIFWRHLVPISATHLSNPAPKDPLFGSEIFRTKPWSRSRGPGEAPPAGLILSLQKAVRAASGASIDPNLAEIGYSLLNMVVAYLDLFPEDVEAGFAKVLKWSARERFAEDDSIAAAIQILKG